MKVVKIVKVILIILGAVLIAINLLAYTSNVYDPPSDKFINILFYLIGWNSAAILGIVFLTIGYYLHKKIQKRKRKQMVDSFLS